jgi:hypothetical protein
MSRANIGETTDDRCVKDHLQKLTSLEFPSDRLTIGALRRRFPDLFDQPSIDDALSECPFLTDNQGRGFGMRDRLYSLLDTERQVALNALVGAKGQARDDWFQSPQEERRTLAELYQEFGIAQGLEHAGQHIRDLEQAAASLAEGKSRR